MERWEEGGVEGERNRRAVMNAMIYLARAKMLYTKTAFQQTKA
jgi:hypothetical protein